MIQAVQDLEPAFPAAQSDVDDVVVVGGASRMPWLRRSLRGYFPPTTLMHMADAVVNAVRVPGRSGFLVDLFGEVE